MRRRLILMRHAEVAYFAEDGKPLAVDAPLTENGREQARAAAEQLAHLRFDRVITSSLRRTRETAEIVAPGRQPEVIPALDELRGGRLADIADDELVDAFTEAFQPVPSEDARFLNGERIGELLDRVLPAVDELLQDPTWEDALAILHGGVNRAIISTALAGGRAFFGGIEQAPACINILDHGPDRWILRTMNYSAHNPVHDGSRATSIEILHRQYLPYRRSG
jgi:probable phosphoglycerate mutase